MQCDIEGLQKRHSLRYMGLFVTDTSRSNAILIVRFTYYLLHISVHASGDFPPVRVFTDKFPSYTALPSLNSWFVLKHRLHQQPLRFFPWRTLFPGWTSCTRYTLPQIRSPRNTLYRMEPDLVLLQYMHISTADCWRSLQDVLTKYAFPSSTCSCTEA